MQNSYVFLVSLVATKRLPPKRFRLQVYQKIILKFRIAHNSVLHWLANGTRLVWLVYTERRLVIVLTHNSEDILGENDTLDGADVLPGFTLPVRDIFPKL